MQNKDAMKAKEKAWWSKMCLKGDPLRDPNLVDKAFEAGWKAALEYMEIDIEY